VLLFFGEALDRVKIAACTIIKKLRVLPDQQNEIQVEFGQKLIAEGGEIVAAAGVEANYAVTLKWKKPEEPKKADGKPKV